MKYLTVCLLLFVVMVCLCLFGAFYITNRVVHIESLLQNAMNAYVTGNISTAQRAIEQAEINWAKCKNSFGILLYHVEFDTVQSDLSTLRVYRKQEDQSDFCSLCSSLLSRLRHIREMEWPYLFNIL